MQCQGRSYIVTLARKFPVAFVATVVLAACSRSTPTTVAPVAAAQYPAIVRLESRHYSINISAGPRCPVYSITNSAGESLVSNISLEDLRTKHPDLFNLLAPALAPKATASAATPVVFADDR
jgi:hypothetical protein